MLPLTACCLGYMWSNSKKSQRSGLEEFLPYSLALVSKIIFPLLSTPRVVVRSEGCWEEGGEARQFISFL